MFTQRASTLSAYQRSPRRCGVSESTVFNYFPTKEALVLDRLDATMASLQAGLAETKLSPIDTALRLLDDTP
jgi:AcrR family transcriptional regulator